eukprot:PhF_6_TR10427/c2_g1_i6/m.16440
MPPPPLRKNPYIGIPELCLWISSETQTQCQDIKQSLQDGHIIASLLTRVFPALVSYRCANSDPWAMVEERAKFLDLPPCLCDWNGIRGAKFASSYSLIVALFFIHHLAQQPDYSADFAHDIPTDVSSFLQSMSCVQVMVKGGVLSASALGIPSQDTSQTSFEFSPGTYHPPPTPPEATPPQQQQHQQLMKQTSPEATTLTDRFEQYKSVVKQDGIQRELAQLRTMVNVYQQICSQHGIDIPLERPACSWPDFATQQRGEFVLKKLRYEVEALRKQLESSKEAHTAREKLFAKRLAQHKIAWLEHQERQRRQTAEEIENIRQAHLVELSNLREIQHRSILEANHNIELQAEQFLQDTETSDPAQLANELIALRRMRVSQGSLLSEVEERTNFLQHAVTTQRDTFKEMIRVQSEAQDALYHKLVSLLDPEDAPPSDEAILLKFREQLWSLEKVAADHTFKEENERLKMRVQEMELMNRLPANLVTELERNVFLQSEIDILKQRIANLTRTNEFLSQQRQNCAAVVNSSNLDAALVGDLAQLASNCYSHVQQLSTDDAFKGLLQQSFWQFVSNAAVIQRKSLATSQTNEVLLKENATFRQQVAALKADVERDQFDSKIKEQSERERWEAAAGAERAALLTEVQVLRSETAELRDQAKTFATKYKGMMQVASAETEARFENLRARHRQATRALTSAKLRESLYRQAVEVQTRLVEKTSQLVAAVDHETTSRINNERQLVESEFVSVMQRIQNSHEYAEEDGSNEPDALDVLVKEATINLKEQRDVALSTLHGETSSLQALRTKVVELEQKLAALESKRVGDENVISSLEHAVRMASADRASALRELEEARAHHATEVRKLQSKIYEFEVCAVEAPNITKLAPMMGGGMGSIPRPPRAPSYSPQQPSPIIQTQQASSYNQSSPPPPSGGTYLSPMIAYTPPNVIPPPQPQANTTTTASSPSPPGQGLLNLAPEIAEARKRISMVLAQKNVTVGGGGSGGMGGAGGTAMMSSSLLSSSGGSVANSPPTMHYSPEEIEEKKKHFLALLNQ